MFIIPLLSLLLISAALIVWFKQAHYKNISLFCFEMTLSLLCFQLGHGALAYCCFILSICTTLVLVVFITSFDHRSRKDISSPSIVIRVLGALICASLVITASLIPFFYNVELIPHEATHVEAGLDHFSAMVGVSLLLFISLLALVKRQEEEAV